jgi:DNA repair protein RecN (Recombination protein N)
MDKVSVSFPKGFSVITGQTGAGKSILLDSIGIILGDRAGLSILRDQNKQGIIVATFALQDLKEDNLDIISSLYDGGFLSSKDERTIIIKKIITKNGSKIFINDIQTTVQFVNNITKHLLEIYSQFEQTDLFSVKKHLDIIDAFGRLDGDINIVKQLYDKYMEANNKYIETQNEIERQKANLEYLQDFVKDVSALKLKENEYDELLVKKRNMTNIDAIATYIKNASNVLDEGKIGIIINKAQKSLQTAEELVRNKDVAFSDGEVANGSANNNFLIKDLQNVNELLEKSYNDYSLVTESVSDLMNKYQFDEAVLNEIEERISCINEVARKYQTTPQQIVEQYTLAVGKISNINLSNTVLEKLKTVVENCKAEYNKASIELSKKRQDTAKRLEIDVFERLKRLKMDSVKFYANFEKIEPTQSGVDKVAFFASMNLGTPPHPLHKIASGGELSRFMLAFKSALCGTQNIGTIIFDEIDTGVSGNVAFAIGKELKHLSSSTQVICITHNSQTASFADSHFSVKKEQSLDNTHTNIKNLNAEERVLAIAEMISGDEVSQESLQNAKKLLETAHSAS